MTVETLNAIIEHVIFFIVIIPVIACFVYDEINGGAKMTREKYQNNKARARSLAIQWQAWQSRAVYDYAQCIKWADIFTAIGLKYGLTREFRENGIL